MDAGIHVNVHEAHPELTSPTTTNIQPFPPETVDAILSHVEGDITTLRSCRLVGASWAALARPYLFRKVVCRPGVPTRTWVDFFEFLATLPDIARCIRWLTINGFTPKTPSNMSAVEIERVLEVLERLPLLIRLYITRVTLPGRQAEDAFESAATMPSMYRRQLQVLSVHSCLVETLTPLYRLLASIASIETFAVHDLILLNSITLPPVPLNTQISAIHVDGSFPQGGRFWASLRHRLPPSSATGVSVSTGLIGGWRAVTSLQELLTAFGTDVQSVSINVLARSCDIRSLVPRPGSVISVPRTSIQEPVFPLFEFIDSTPIILDLQLSLHSDCRTVLHDDNNWRILSNAPANITNIELRFQRYGPHVRSVLDDMRAINDPVVSRRAQWSTLDEGTLARFPHLEAFLCVLCDGGFLEQYGPFQGAEPVGSGPSCSRQQEFDNYVKLLKGVLPRMHERSILQFKMSDV
ncbi:hypothetical protein OH76DRAFT_1485611 [Lentinus brumalis]|uniref:F-box domain-containing protein n=1 Tax=Lentinus brumalis TaxID=2498619 RepID=A0A371D1G0_9APHY|nr:hypothetical protein OH76DRAFT_1485611 [Polyporus brumalis]